MYIKRIIVTIICLCVLLAGCSNWLDGSYHSIKPHKGSNSPIDPNNMPASNYAGLQDALGQMVYLGVESGIISISKYPPTTVEQDMRAAVRYTTQSDPIGSYAVESIAFEIGTSAGQPAIAVSISYRHTKSEIRRIKNVRNAEEFNAAVVEALEQCSNSIVLYATEYATTDLAQWVSDYAALHPDIVMEIPQLTVNLYPEIGIDRVVELKFTYQTSRDSLRNMQDKVRPVFESATLYVSGDGDSQRKYAQLYSFLMERFDYHIQTSITPAYSLLNHGVGDSEAFATVYAAMCRGAGLECQTVLGTRDGEVCYWNIIKAGSTYSHVDLLLSDFRELSDSQMMADGYVWDFSAYPVCQGPDLPDPPQPTEPSQPTEPTDPSLPTEPSEPTEPTDPSLPTEPTEPIDPTDPTEPSQPTEPTDPSLPTEPTEPIDPTDPTEPPQPTEPTEPVDPTGPTEPSEPTLPSEPTEPMQPSEPVEPTQPSEPMVPTEPWQPTEPSTEPTQPTVPEEPAYPDPTPPSAVWQ